MDGRKIGCKNVVKEKQGTAQRTTMLPRVVRGVLWCGGVAALLGAVVVWLVQANAAAVVEHALRKAGISTLEQGWAQLDIVGGHLVMADWVVDAPGEVSTRRSRAALDTLVLRGFTKTDWLLHRRFEAAELLIVMDSVVWCGKPVNGEVDSRKAEESFNGFAVGHMRMSFRTVQCRTRDGPEVGITDLTGDLRDCRWLQDHDADLPIGGRGSLRTGPVLVQGREQRPVRIAAVHVDVDDRSVVLNGITFGSDSTIERDASQLELEADLVTVAVDTARAEGVSFAQGTDRMQLNAERIVVSGARIHVARDKRLPDPAFRYRPLVAGLLRALPAGSGADTVLLNDVAVTYHERAEHGAVFGRLPFHHIAGTITGLSHFADTTSTMIEAEGFLFDSARVRMHLRTASNDTTERFVARARLQGMPLADLAPILQPLADVRPVSGWLSEIGLTMEGDDRTGRGVVSMSYNDLKLAKGDRLDKSVGDAIGSAFLNALVRKRPRADADHDREGAFTIQRRRDRSIFNMLWRGTREGALNILLPGVAKGRQRTIG